MILDRLLMVIIFGFNIYVFDIGYEEIFESAQPIK